MEKAGRELERLVAILEELLRPEGLRVSSPDRIRDTITGRLREVDVAIRASDGGRVIAICECRDRANAEDVTWVEQVVTKARDLEDSPPAVLVSSSGFSEPAKEKARNYGHDVRLVTDVTIDEFRSWFQVEHTTVEELERQLLGCAVELTPEDAESFAPELSDLMDKEGLAAAIFDRQKGDPVSPLQVFENWFAEKAEQVQKDVPQDGVPFRRWVPISFSEPEECFSIQTDLGPRSVAVIHLHVQITRSRRLVPVSRATRYSGKDGDLAENIEFHLVDELGTVSFHKVADGPTHVRFRPGDD